MTHLNRTVSAVAVAVAAAGTLLLTGCAPAEPQTLSIAARGGEIPDAVIAGFEADTGISVTGETFDSDETMIAELGQDGNGYDIVEPSQYVLGALDKRGLVEEIDHSKLEGFENLAETFRDPSFDPGNAHGIPWVWGATGILDNEACTGRAITSWQDLWDTRFAGKVTMLDEMFAVYTAGLQVNGFSAASTSTSEINAATATLLRQKPMLAGYNGTDYADLVGSGAICIAEAYSGTEAAAAVDANHDVHFTLPTEGGALWTNSFSIVNGTDASDAAYQWLNYTLRPEVAALVTDGAGLASTNAAARGVIADTDLLTNPAVYAPEEQLPNAEFITDPGVAMPAYLNGWVHVWAP